jgi:hypothetical protein
MTGKSSKDAPQISPAGARTAQARQERLAAALRANLGRRKAQARERAEDAKSDLPDRTTSARLSPSEGDG